MSFIDCLPVDRWLVSTGNFLYHARKALLPIIAASLIISIKPALFLGSPMVDYAMTAVGLVVILLGETLRLATIGFAYIHRGGKNRQVYATKLVVKGFYAHTRNPMYLGNFLNTIGLSLLYGSFLVTCLIFITFGFVYRAVIAAEEDFLSRKFGQEYEDYRRTTNRFWPKWRGLNATLRQFDHYNWRRAVDKESGTLIETAFIGVALVAWKTYYLYGFTGGATTFTVLAVIGLLATSYALLVRHWRRTGFLVSDTPNAHSDPG